MTTAGSSPGLPPASALPLRYMDLVLAFSFVAILIVLIVPLAPVLIDLCITTNIVLAILLLMIVLGAREPLELSTFPALLLFTTLVRLSLNVASTRSILLRGFAGGVIQSFGGFVVGGDIVIGLVIFLILIIIQFVVITKGATRISEVSARFTLDAMPGKQMSIDADLNSGLITEEQARSRRETISQEAEFYGAMDGASKFVRGDAIAGLIITAVNILGGIVMGLRGGLSVGEAIKKYSILTVGDGLVSQIPALFIATAAAILVTKASSRERLSRDIGYQFFSKPGAFGISCMMTLAIGSIPGLPKLPFYTLAGALGIGFLGLRRRISDAEADVQRKALQPSTQPEILDTKAMTELLQVDPIRIDIGISLVPLVDPERGGDLVGHVTNVRKQLATQLGLVVPPIHVRDNLQIAPDSYKILVRGQEMGSGQLRPNWCLALGGDEAEAIRLGGVPTTDPAFGLPAHWILPERRAEAEIANFTVIDCVAVLVTHLTEVLRDHAADILSRDGVQQLLDTFKETSPTVVEELIPNLLTVGDLQKVLQILLREKVSVRNLGMILETCADHAGKTKDPAILSEMVRQRLARSICDQHQDEEGTLHVLTLDPKLEQTIHDALASSPEYGPGALHPDVARAILETAARQVQALAARGIEPSLLVKASLRRMLADLVTGALPRTAVLSYNEATSARKIENVGTIRIAPAAIPVPQEQPQP